MTVRGRGRRFNFAREYLPPDKIMIGQALACY